MFSTGAARVVNQQVRLRGGVESSTLAANLTLDERSSHVQVLDPGGANRDVTLPANELTGDAPFLIFNDADADERLAVKKPGGTTLATLHRGEGAVFAGDGSDWYLALHVGDDSSTGNQPDVIADPGDGQAIPVTSSGTCALVTAGAETRTLAIPTFRGQRLLLFMDTDGGNGVVTVASPVNEAGNNTLTFDDVGETIELVGITIGGTLAWRIAANDGVGLTTV